MPIYSAGFGNTASLLRSLWEKLIPGITEVLLKSCLGDLSGLGILCRSFPMSDASCVCGKGSTHPRSLACSSAVRSQELGGARDNSGVEHKGKALHF